MLDLNFYKLYDRVSRRPKTVLGRKMESRRNSAKNNRVNIMWLKRGGAKCVISKQYMSGGLN